MTAQQQIGPEALLRRIEVFSDDGKDTVVFVTNNRTLSAATIAAVYRERWQIELFFKSIKGSLRIKTFVGTSENAVQIQIWTALIAMLLLRMMKLRSSFYWSLSNLIAMLRPQLFVYRSFDAWLEHPFDPQPAALANDQIVMDWAVA